MAKFETKKGELYIGGKKVIRGWESYSGWYWFATKKLYKQNSVIGGKTYKDDQIWFGFVQGQEEEWGQWSQGELESLGKFKVWEIKKRDLPHSGRGTHY